MAEATPLDEAYALGRARWPGVEVERARFAAFVEARAGSDPRAARCELLYLTCGCAAGDAAALAAFAQAYEPVIDAALARMANAVADADEVKQRVRERLFVGDA